MNVLKYIINIDEISVSYIQLKSTNDYKKRIKLAQEHHLEGSKIIIAVIVSIRKYFVTILANNKTKTFCEYSNAFNIFDIIWMQTFNRRRNCLPQ